MTITCGKAPCKSCPYRRDVPSGVWMADEYDKLPAYDGTMGEQALNQNGLFFCHQLTGKICAGWIATHGPHNLLALRMTAVAESVWTYKSPVPVFASGAEAAAHGKREIGWPGREARRTMAQVVRRRQRDPSDAPIAARLAQWARR